MEDLKAVTLTQSWMNKEFEAQKIKRQQVPEERDVVKLIELIYL